MTTDRRISGDHLRRMLGDWRTGTRTAAHALLAGRLRLLVVDGRLPLHTRLPAERELAGALGVSRTTVVAAYDRLREEGFLHSRRGAGTWTQVPATGAAPPAAWVATPDEAVLDLAYSSPAAPVALLHAAAGSAVTQLARHLPTPGYHPLGLAPLREAVAARFAARGLPTTPGQILVTAGAQQAFMLILRALAEPGERVLVEHPTYPNALDAVRRHGARPVPVASGAADGGWDLDMLAATLRHTAPRLAYLIPDFHNPTGRCVDADQRAALVALAERTRTRLVVDETMVELGLDHPAPPPTAAYEAAEGDLVLTVGSMSKTFWGGLRVGWLRAPAALVHRLAAARASVDAASPVLEQLIALELVHQTDEVAADRRRTLTAARDHLLGRLATHLPGWRAAPPPGGLSLWVDLGAPVSSALTVAAERHGVRLAAGPRFGLDGAFERYLRLPYTLPTDQLDAAVERIAAAHAGLGTGAPAAPPVRAMV